MAFIVEDGTGLSAATSYLSVADFKAHHDDRGSDWSSYTDEDIQAALVVATDYADVRWYYVGFRRNRREQALEWPRIAAIDPDGYSIDSGSVPSEIREAVAALALIQLTDGLFQEIEFDPTGGQLIEKTDVVGSVRRTRRYSDAGAQVIQRWKAFPGPDALLRRLADTKPATLVRA